MITLSTKYIIIFCKFQENLKIGTENKFETNQRLVETVRYHQSIIDLTREFEDLFSNIGFLVIFSDIFVICMTMYNVGKVRFTFN